MPIDVSQGDLARAPSSEPDMQFPDYVEIRLVWGNKARSYKISADQFFGRGGIGAPLSGDAIIQHINRLRRMGKPA